nr:tetratricopeptide repeat protein [Luteimonas sp. XNQY3]
MQAAVAAHRDGDAATATAHYERALAHDPGQPDALHFLGVMRHQAGDSEAAIALIARALVRAPRHADIHNNLGNIHKEWGDAVAAEACYRRALTFQPGHFTAVGNLAVALEMQGRLDDAFRAYGLLLTVAPSYAHGYHLLGLFLRNHARDPEHGRQAAACLRRAWELDPDNLRALAALGNVLYLLGEHDAARQVYRDWLLRDPESPLARHMLAACGGAEAPARAGDAYVRSLFDSFADSFDEQLLQHLDYRAPQLLADALGAALGGRRDLDILDAGCGTGLCAALLRPWARRLDGVDLSPGMLARARRRGGYDALVEGELTAHLEAHPGAFDVVASADTLVYFGDLRRVCAAAHAALRAHGWFGFSVEALEAGAATADGIELGPSGRYRHTRAHLETALLAAGFGDQRIAPRDLRNESGAPVHGWVAVARRGAG